MPHVGWRRELLGAVCTDLSSGTVRRVGSQTSPQWLTNISSRSVLRWIPRFSPRWSFSTNVPTRPCWSTLNLLCRTSVTLSGAVSTLWTADSATMTAATCSLHRRPPTRPRCSSTLGAGSGPAPGDRSRRWITSSSSGGRSDIASPTLQHGSSPKPLGTFIGRCLWSGRRGCRISKVQSPGTHRTACSFRPSYAVEPQRAISWFSSWTSTIVVWRRASWITCWLRTTTISTTSTSSYGNTT
mmetsp:Transcript_48032/g.112924  ORF Transcript_48032/g.112924 Transcript_48032/m.112924 type:complete len:241 (-) Transcript_48032:214-936(-)